MLYNTFKENIIQWINNVEQLTNRKVMIYTSKHFWEIYKTKLDNESINLILQYPVWLAQYNYRKDEPDALAGWNKWNFWQYCGDCYINGIKGQANVNIFIVIDKSRKQVGKLIIGCFRLWFHRIHD